jgi:23S rRNA pseudouridine1911/1915/1917 synthase
VDLAGLRLDQALAKMLPDYSRSRIAAWLRDARIRVGGEVAKPKQKVWGGEAVQMDSPAMPETSVFQPQALALNIVHEDDALLVIDKPAGLVVHPGSGNWSGTMLNALLNHCDALASIPRGGIVHRLDKDTSGLLVVAKTLTAQTHLVRQLQARTVTRIYGALVRGDITQSGTVDAPIGRHPQHRTRMAVVATGREARTHYRPLERFGAATWIECKLDTGRTHQIRVHLAAIGHPVIGDPVYSRRPAGVDATALKRQALHAMRLELRHPLTQTLVSWRSPLPADIVATLQGLREGAGR